MKENINNNISFIWHVNNIKQFDKYIKKIYINKKSNINITILIIIHDIKSIKLINHISNDYINILNDLNISLKFEFSRNLKSNIKNIDIKLFEEYLKFLNSSNFDMWQYNATIINNKHYMLLINKILYKNIIYDDFLRYLNIFILMSKQILIRQDIECFNINNIELF